MIVIKHRKSPDVVLLRVNARRLDDWDLTGAYLLGAGMAGLRGRRLILREANLRNADLRGADLRGAVLHGAVLRGADLRGGNLSDARLVEADLRGADLRTADLRGADLSRAMLFEANLAGVRCDARTSWPRGESWGLLVRPTASQRSEAALPAALAAGSRWLAFRAHAFRRNLAEWKPAPVSAPGPAVCWSAVGMAMALLMVAMADRHQSPINRSGSQFAELPRITERGTHTDAVPPPRVHRAPTLAHHGRSGHGSERIARVPGYIFPAHPRRAVAKHEIPSRVTRSRVAGLRLARRDAVKPTSQEAVSPDAGAVTDWRSSGRSIHAGFAVQTAFQGPQRSSKSLPPAPDVPSAVPEVVAAAPVTPPVVAPEPAPLSRPKSKRESRRREGPVAWGNSEFYYGSGYDIYGMHLDRAAE